MTNQDNGHNLKSRAMLIFFHVSQWYGRKFDREASNEVTTAKHAEKNAARVNKHLLPRNPKEFTAVRNAVSRARDVHKQYTAPWGEEDALRLLPSAMVDSHAIAMKKALRDVDVAVEKFVSAYLDLKEEAKSSNGELYKESDWPTVEDLRARFSYKFSIMPWTDAADFRCDLNADTVSAIKSQIEADNEEALRAISRDLVSRLIEPVTHMAKVLSDPEKTFKDTLVKNIDELVEILPLLNLTHDREVEDAIDRARKLTVYRPQQLRDSNSKRNATAIEADLLAKDLGAYFRK